MLVDREPVFRPARNDVRLSGVCVIRDVEKPSLLVIWSLTVLERECPAWLNQVRMGDTTHNVHAAAYLHQAKVS